jgi:hypothetical protein
MIVSLLVGLLTLSSLLSLSGAKEFTDDRGIVFSWPDNGTAPTIVVNANGALALFNLGRSARNTGAAPVN